MALVAAQGGQAKFKAKVKEGAGACGTLITGCFRYEPATLTR